MNQFDIFILVGIINFGNCIHTYPTRWQGSEERLECSCVRTCVCVCVSFMRWNIKLIEDKPQAICFSHRWRPVESYLTLKGRQVPFVNNVKYLGVIFDKKKWHGKYIQKLLPPRPFEHLLAFTPFWKVNAYASIQKLILYTALISSKWSMPALHGNSRRTAIFKIAAALKRSSPHHGKFTKVYADPRFPCGV
jgi:hypothetical protein